MTEKIKGLVLQSTILVIKSAIAGVIAGIILCALFIFWLESGMAI